MCNVYIILTLINQLTLILFKKMRVQNLGFYLISVITSSKALKCSAHVAHGRLSFLLNVVSEFHRDRNCDIGTHQSSLQKALLSEDIIVCEILLISIPILL